MGRGGGGGLGEAEGDGGEQSVLLQLFVTNNFAIACIH